MTALTLPPVSSVAAMEGRELDAAVARHVLGLPQEYWCHHHGVVWEPKHVRNGICIEDDCGKVVQPFGKPPEYSTSEGPSFFAMLHAVEEAGWVVCIRSGLGWCSVELSKFDERGIRIGHIQPPAEATLPLAMARAALLTCYPGWPSE